MSPEPNWSSTAVSPPSRQWLPTLVTVPLRPFPSFRRKPESTAPGCDDSLESRLRGNDEVAVEKTKPVCQMATGLRSERDLMVYRPAGICAISASNLSMSASSRLKYLACGWWNTTADTEPSGSIM